MTALSDLSCPILLAPRLIINFQQINYFFSHTIYYAFYLKTKKQIPVSLNQSKQRSELNYHVNF